MANLLGDGRIVPCFMGSIDGGILMTKRIPMKGGDEYEGLTKARKFHLWKSGQLKKIKRAYNKRLRKHNKDVNDEGLL